MGLRDTPEMMAVAGMFTRCEGTILGKFHEFRLPIPEMSKMNRVRQRRAIAPVLLLTGSVLPSLLIFVVYVDLRPSWHWTFEDTILLLTAILLEALAIAAYQASLRGTRTAMVLIGIVAIASNIAVACVAVFLLTNLAGGLR